MMGASEIIIRQIEINQLDQILPLVAQLNKDVSLDVLKSRLTMMTTKGFQCLGAYKEEKLVGVAGYWLGYRFWGGKYIDIDNFVVDENHRSHGIGNKLMEALEKIAEKENCEISVLDTYTQNHRSHKFYHQKDYQIVGFHFYKKLKRKD